VLGLPRFGGPSGVGLVFDMAIFPRRVVQRILNENAAFLSREQMENHVFRLNGGDRDPLAAEWEVVVLNAFSKRGVVKHEEKSEGSSKVDLSFYLNESNVVEFIAEIRAVSDDGLHKENPVAEFQRQLNQRLRKRGVKEGGFHLEIASLDRIPQLDRKLKLALPKKGDIGEFINKELGPFFDQITSQSSRPHTIVLDRPDLALKITFAPNARFVFSHYPAYTAAYHRKRNPVSQALEDKADQLKWTNYSGPRGIILCDGSCNLMQPGPHQGVSFSLSQLVERFLGSNRSVSFVLALVAVEVPTNSPRNVESRIVGTLFINPNARNPVSRESEQILRTIDENFAKPVRCATTAQHLLRRNQPQVGLSHIGGYCMQSLEIKVSSRSLVSLMAGKPAPNWPITKEPTVGEFHPGATEFFKRHLEKGRTIQLIRLERDDNFDDDWVVITFSPPDPALSPYVVPDRGTSSFPQATSL